MTTVFDVVREICLGLPETEEVLSHGFPNFKVAGKAFATYSLNHHGDGKVALLVSLSRDMQQMLIESAPLHFYVPPYTGNKGWVGIELNKGIKWERVAQLATDAYRKIAPMALAESAQAPSARAPTETMKPEDINPYVSKTNQALLKKLTQICDPLPEVSESTQFGAPCFKAGKKTFCTLHQWRCHTEIQIWVGAERQLALTSFDQRYRIPAYTGHNGWIGFDLSGKPSWKEVEVLLTESYRHFALKRMLKLLESGI